MKQVHHYQIIHRDIKAANIFLDKNNSAKLADFGIARVLSTDTSKANTRIGTPAYMAPEMFDEKAHYGTPVDIWSLGVVLYQMHTLELPFKSNTMSQVIR